MPSFLQNDLNSATVVTVPLLLKLIIVMGSKKCSFESFLVKTRMHSTSSFEGRKPYFLSFF